MDQDTTAKIVFRQILAIFNLSTWRLFKSRFMAVNMVLGALPIAIVTLVLCFEYKHIESTGMTYLYANFDKMFRTFYLHFIVFFVANIFGFAVVRQELDEQTLHFLLLQPIRRWSLVLGKLLAYLFLSTSVCLVSLWVIYLGAPLVVFGPKALVLDLFGEWRILELIRMSFVLFLGLMAYGAIAMMMGSMFKSGLYAILLLGWEAGLAYLPATLKLWTVAHYLHSLLPTPLQSDRKIFEMLGEPASVPVSLIVLFSVSSIMVAVSMLVFQFRECTYSEA